MFILVSLFFHLWKLSLSLHNISTYSMCIYIVSDTMLILVYLNNITRFLTSSISAILSGTIGIHYGHVLIHFKVTKSYHILYYTNTQNKHLFYKLNFTSERPKTEEIFGRVIGIGSNNGSQWDLCYSQ